MFFNSIKEIKWLRKKIKRLLSKGMSKRYFKVTIEKFSKLHFLGLKYLSSLQFLGSSNSNVDIIEF